MTAQVQDYYLVESKFELNRHFYHHFQTNAFGKGMNALIPQTMG